MNEHAVSLRKAAEQYAQWNSKCFADDKEMLEQGHQDYEDLVAIIEMIENGEHPEKIAKAMWTLDTAVRDVIPESAYYAYTLEDT